MVLLLALYEGHQAARARQGRGWVRHRDGVLQLLACEHSRCENILCTKPTHHSKTEGVRQQCLFATGQNPTQPGKTQGGKAKPKAIPKAAGSSVFWQQYIRAGVICQAEWVARVQ
jgi:hypothetical protein